MTESKVITMDSGVLGRALWFLNNSWRLLAYFIILCFISFCLSLLSFQLSDPFLAWNNLSPFIAMILSAGVALFILVALSVAGLFFLPIAGLGTNLYRINRTIRSKLRASSQWGAVTKATLFAGAFAFCVFIGGLAALAEWNQRVAPGMIVLTFAVAGLTLLLAGFIHYMPVLRRWFYFRSHETREGRGDFILLLRSFKADELHTRTRGFMGPDAIEPMVVDMLERFAWVRAVSNPRDLAQPVGAERFVLKTPEWQPAVLDLMDRAAAIVIVLDASPGLTWELDRIVEGKRLAKTIFVVWSPERGWLKGAWVELFKRIGIHGTVSEPDGCQNKIALAATCSNDRILVAIASSHTPLNCGLAVSTLLYMSVFAPLISRSGRR